MYCVNCGVELADTENKCPLCNTEVYHPVIKQIKDKQLYPSGKMPEKSTISKNMNGAVIVLLSVILFICFFSDIQMNGNIDWFGYVAGAILLMYVIFALPLWFIKPNPVIFTGSGVVAAILYLLYINIAVKGNWFLPFAFPVAGVFGFIIISLVTLLRYIKKGKLYIYGGFFITIGFFMLLLEFMISVAFAVKFIGWSVYPLAVMLALGGVLIYLAINSSAREIMERKLFF